MKKFKNILCLGLSVLLLACSLCACGDEDKGKVIFTTGFGEDELFRIGDISCTMPEYMLYLTNMQNDYESVFGARIWELTYEDTTLEENVKDIALAQIAQIKSVYLLAKEKQITLSPEEEQKLAAAAKEYFASLSSSEVESLQITEEMIFQMYVEFAMAQLVYEQIVAEVNPEISDDEARTVTIEQIVIKNRTTDYEGNVIDYSEAMKADNLETIQEIHEMATSGDYDFTTLAGKYNEEKDIRCSVKKGQVQKVLEDAIFNLQTEEISSVIESDYGYHIVKCISTYDKEETDANKLVIIEQRKKEAFSQEYDAFVNKLARKLNDKLWQQVDLIHSQDVKTSSFFEVFDKYFTVN